ncbi:hypothetical protein EPUL_005352, partial [Erysiphe pulchra]
RAFSIPKILPAMETVNGTQRQSGIRSIVNWDSYKGSCDFSYHPNNMAAAVAVNSSYSYPIDVPSRYEVASSAFAGRSPSLHNLITHTDSRWPPKTHNDSTHSQASLTRLSLPSIHEALRSKYEDEESVPPSLPQSQDRQFAPSQTPTIPRTYPLSEQSKFPSNGQPPPPQHPAHPQRHSFSRSLEPMNTPFLETLQHPSVPAPTSQNSYKARIEGNRYERELQASERPLSGHSHHSISNRNYDSSRTSSMPPSNQGTSFIQSELPSREYQETFEMWRKPRDNDKPDIACKIRGGIKRNLDVWDFENNLAEINMASSALKEWSAHYNAIAQDRQLSSSALTERMPSIDSLKEIRQHQQKIYVCLEQLTRIISEADQQKGRSTVEQRSQEVNGQPKEYDEDTTMSHVEEPKSNGFTSEAKKRRGRAAPPGRCHSCNRAETPEWRRGPDGARTL